ncbi:hypothetical protein LNTAR_14582 [Lentisphaera araneosa HTCC2155]|uniref:Four helix bundle protein n=1 Tax=Lentisphaera araneosa HTCC2155 TaxID=313628 RepID=A6DHG8_9BACT|nr:four helix bundle protein [Lentisphaera araneosa]EDM29051.1 hypothetical protein LNTAR_14582 [Lentisphaera araneosa HTCC2155]
MNFEDLEIWKRSVKLSIAIYKETLNLKDYGFKDQITRSSLSIPSNIAEGMLRDSVKETQHFLSYSKASCAELQTQIIIGKEVGFLKEGFCLSSYQECKELIQMISSFSKKLN